MESTQPQLICASEFAPVTGETATPFSQQTVMLTKQDHIELKWKANYWKAQYERLQGRDAALKAEVEAHLATIRDLKQRLYGTKSEKSSGGDQTGESKPASPRKRGQQPGSKGHGRSDPYGQNIETRQLTSTYGGRANHLMPPFGHSI